MRHGFIDGLNDEQTLALAAAWDRADMSRRFIELARTGGTAQIKLSWCLYTSASGLWSAVNIAQEKVRGSRERETDAWFLERRFGVINELRHGGVHHSARGSEGIGFRFTGGGVEFFLNSPGGRGQVPVTEVVELLAAALAMVDAFLTEIGGGLRAVTVP